MIFKELSLKQIKQMSLEGENPFSAAHHLRLVRVFPYFPGNKTNHFSYSLEILWIIVLFLIFFETHSLGEFFVFLYVTCDTEIHQSYALVFVFVFISPQVSKKHTLGIFVFPHTFPVICKFTCFVFWEQHEFLFRS